MAGTSQSGKDAGDPPAVDLSALQDLSFGPDWTSGKPITTHTRDSRERGKRGDRGSGPRSGPPARRDRRPSRPPREKDAQEGRESRGGPRRRDRREEAPQEEYQPVVEVLFYPEDIPFKALCHAIKTSCRTYELFELARLILSKPDRFVIVMKPLDGVPGLERFVVSVPDGLPFESEEAALAHVIKHHLDRFFTTEEVEIDPPKGSFLMVNRCGVTGELLGPPNYHRYQALVAEHHARRVPNMAFERFQQKIEAVKDQEVIDAWLKKMSHVVRYKVVSPREGEPEYLDGAEAAKHFLLAKRRSEVIRESEQVRLSGKSVDLLPDGPIARSIKAVLDRQLRFPLDTANNLRGRLRRMNFTIYKRGSKGVSYVCAVKRSFRDSNTRFSESLQELIDFIENHQNINVSTLPETFLGITLEKGGEQPLPPEKAPAIDKVSEEEAARIVEAHEKNRLAEQEESGEAEQEESGEAEQESGDTADKASEPAPVVRKQSLSAEEKQVHQLFADLRWLVSEGYVTEFGDGKLFANPPVAVAPKPSASEAAEAVTAAAEDSGSPKEGSSTSENPDASKTEEAAQAASSEPEAASDAGPAAEEVPAVAEATAEAAPEVVEPEASEKPKE
ncbi:hypothetical protein H5P28_11180 [Ruficoccus amylovorans]|uniref:Uncharacterized protein n=1 Tax=Ruficoccus amylovorans TaxID=1804625 RepID=A0A842HHW5_9BACT|nr:hypothetical protein [Ruficoccus amylovorans]MBC2594821.1 hypothetical protein [Ruficoccus amylovorans]